MENLNNILEVKQSVALLREHLETIRINLEILEILKLNGRIKETDKPYVEINDLDCRNRKYFNEFILSELPGLIEPSILSDNQVLRKSYLDWAGEMRQSLSLLDRLIKDYMRKLMGMDKVRSTFRNDLDIKDKRFWKFLEEVKDKHNLFESFEDPGIHEKSEQAPDSEISETEQ